jgi:hypothetical protein
VDAFAGRRIMDQSTCRGKRLDASWHTSCIHR